jgi:hypothetical protein
VSTDGFDSLADAGPLVAGQVVHDDHVAASEVGHEDLSDIGFEPVAVDRADEHHRAQHNRSVGGRSHGYQFAISS